MTQWIQARNDCGERLGSNLKDNVVNSRRKLIGSEPQCGNRLASLWWLE